MGDDCDDFGKHIIPEAIHKVNVFAHAFTGYWEDIGTIRSFYDANLALTDARPAFDFYQPDAPVYTHARFLAGARMESCRIENGIVAEGSYICDAQIQRSVIGIRSILGPGVKVFNSIVMGADYYETPIDIERNNARSIPNVGIGANSSINRAIIDKNARIGERVIISNDENITEAEGENYYIRDGIVVVPKDAVIKAGTVI